MPSNRTKSEVWAYFGYYKNTDPLKMIEKAVVYTPGLQVVLKIHQKWRRRNGVCALSLHTVNKQTVDGETEHKEEDENGYCRETRIVCVDR